MKNYLVTMIGTCKQGHHQNPTTNARTVSRVVQAETAEAAADEAWQSEWALMRRNESMTITTEVSA